MFSKKFFAVAVAVLSAVGLLAPALQLRLR